MNTAGVGASWELLELQMNYLELSQAPVPADAAHAGSGPVSMRHWACVLSIYSMQPSYPKERECGSQG